MPLKRGRVPIPREQTEPLRVQAGEPALQPCSLGPGRAAGAGKAGNCPFGVGVKCVDSSLWNNREFTALGAEEETSWTVSTEFNISKTSRAYLTILNYQKYPVTISRLKSTHSDKS